MFALSLTDELIQYISTIPFAKNIDKDQSLEYIRSAIYERCTSKTRNSSFVVQWCGGDKMTETPIAGRSGLRISGILMDLGNTLYTLRMMYVCTDTVSSTVVKIALKAVNKP